MTNEFTTISIKRATKEELDLILEDLAPIIAKISGKSVRKISYDDLIRFLLKHVKFIDKSVLVHANQ